MRDVNDKSYVSAWKAAAVWGTATLIFCLVARHGQWRFNDWDSYYHVAIARKMRVDGWVVNGLDWARLSVFHEHFGDKEFLFHCVLALLPGEPVTSGLLALSLLNSLTIATFGFLGVLWGGRTGWFAPIVLLSVNPALFARMDMLRPHHIAVLLLFAAAWVIASGHHRLMLLVGCLYAMSYTAWQTLPMFCLAYLAIHWTFQRRLEWAPAAYGTMGVTLGVLLHPSFPDNLVTWSFQNFDFFKELAKGTPGFGTEILPLSTMQWIKANSPGLVMVVGTLANHRGGFDWKPVDAKESALLSLFLISGALYLKAFRFCEYFIPFAGMYGVVLYSRLSMHPTRWGRVPRQLIPASCLGVAALLSVSGSNWRLQDPARLQGSLPSFDTPEEVRSFSEAVPANAKIAATWDQTAYLVYAAPQGSYLNLLDPIFMIAYSPRTYAAAYQLYNGAVTDVASTVKSDLDSDYLAYDSSRSPGLFYRIGVDPRLEAVFKSSRYHLYRIHPAKEAGFMLDWSLLAAPDSWSALKDALLSGARPVLPSDPEPKGFKAFIEPDPEVKAPDCWWAYRSATFTHDLPVQVGFSSAGATEIYINGSRIASYPQGHLAMIDSAIFPFEYPANEKIEIGVYSCKSPLGNGFYWREWEIEGPPDPSEQPILVH